MLINSNRLSMKILLLSLAAFLTADEARYSFKSSTVARRPVEKQVVSCYPDDIRELYKLEAATAVFAALHPNPLKFNLADAKGKTVTFKTGDGASGNAYEIENKNKTNNYLFVIHEWYGLNDYIKQEAGLLSSELDNVNVIALDLYDGKVANTADRAMKYVQAANPQRLENIIRGAIDYAG